MVIYNYYLVVCLLSNILQDRVAFGEVTCKSTGPCSCVLSNGKGAVDFSPTKGLGSAPLYSASTVGADTAKFDPCREFQCGSDTSRVCLIDGAISPSIETGVGNDISYQYDEFGGLVTFVYTQGKYTTYIEVHCESGLSGAGLLSEFTQRGKTNFFYATLKSKYACLTEDKRKKKLSTGTVLCILVLVIIFLYVVIGVIVNKYIRKLEGEEVFPNIKFWKDFPSLVKDGFMFTKNKLCKSKGDYTDI
ncbi:uncharacterized protein LOC130621807 [Hydractinia symbiolongicarpus]|uniref:uncharacterized protein LOC130621807 n=1 Tax=Hydractinia symbiolongicarpus TaxID=13093 RepID=UPI00254D1AA6|nr:uncharacterized protein LOC130621807 [Hydractinia symbiolongicarpus]